MMGTLSVDRHDRYPLRKVIAEMRNVSFEVKKNYRVF